MGAPPPPYPPGDRRRRRILRPTGCCVWISHAVVCSVDAANRHEGSSTTTHHHHHPYPPRLYSYCVKSSKTNIIKNDSLTSSASDTITNFGRRRHRPTSTRRRTPQIVESAPQLPLRLPYNITATVKYNTRQGCMDHTYCNQKSKQRKITNTQTKLLK